MKKWLIAAAAATLTACAGGGKPVPEDRFYQLDNIVPVSAYSAPQLEGGLEITYTHADPLRSDRAVLYTENDRPLQLRRFHYAYWVDQPPRLVHRALVGYLRDLNVADQVFAEGRFNQAAYRLDTSLLKFEQWRNGNTFGVELALQARLQRLSEDQALWTRTYTERRSSAGTDMHASASAMQEALGRVLQTLGDDLAAAGSSRQ